MENSPARKTSPTAPSEGLAPPGRTSGVRAAFAFVSGEHGSGRVAGELRFDPAEPYAVTMHLRARGGDVEWTFARELLADGLYGPVGEGDVQVWPCLASSGEAVVIIELSSPGGMALLQAPSRRVQEFVTRTCEVVPLGREAEHLAIDELVALLLESPEA